MSKLAIVDGNAIIHRAYHAMPALTTPTGEPIGAVQGFVNILLKIIEDLSPTHLVVCWDRKEKTFRHKAYKEYQSHRVAIDDDLTSQFSKARKVLDAFGIEQFSKAGYEADDLIGTIAQKAVNQKIKSIVIVTGDKDQLQLVNKSVKVYMPVRGISTSVLLGEKEVKEKLGVYPNQVIDLKAFMGDQSDHYPGVYGIGPKTAQELLEKYKTYDNVYKNIDNIKENVAKKLQDGKKEGDISYMLATIVTDLTIDVDFVSLSKWKIESEKALDVFKLYGFKTLTKRIKGEHLLSVDKSPSIEKIKKVAAIIAKELAGKKYAVRGTASLVLQGFDMGVDDIDILCDKNTALSCNTVFNKYLTEKVEYKESDKYKSYYGKFVIDGVSVEVMGNWKICNSKSEDDWSEVFDASGDYINITTVDGVKIRLTKPEHELAVYTLEGRWSAYHKLNKQIQEKNQKPLF